jgi:two-component system chemotaxis response regulator CheY
MKKRWLLSVDDNALSRKLIRRMLEGAAFEIDDAASAEEALAKAKARQYDCALIDITLPRVSGTELARHLRQGEHPIGDLIACTAHHHFGLTPGAAEFDDILVKPFMRAHLLEKLGRLKE